MAQDTMTRSQLVEIIKETTLPVVQQFCDKDVVDKIKATVEAMLAPFQQRQEGHFERMLAAMNGGAKQVAEATLEKGLHAARFLRAVALSKREGTGFEGALGYLKSWGNPDIAEATVDYRQKTLAAGVANAGGYLVAPQYSNDILELRRAKTVVRAAGPRIYPMPNGTLHLSKVTSGVSGDYIGENSNAPKNTVRFGENILTWKKLAVVVPISNDLLRYASVAADMTVRDDLVRGLSVTEDGQLLRGQGVNGYPKGIRNWAAAGNILSASTASLANAASDMGRLVLALLNNNIPAGNWRIFWAPRTWFYLYTLQTTTGDFAFQAEMKGGTFYGFPFTTSTQIPVNLTVGANNDCSEIYLVNMDDMALGDSERLTIDTSSEAAYFDGSSVVSAFSLDQTVIRAIAEHDFVARDENAIAVLDGVRWGV